MLPIGMNFMFAGKANIQQENIPVGCVPSAAVTVVGGVCASWERGCVLPGGGVCASEGGVLPRGMLLGGAVCASQGVCFLGGVLPRDCASRGCASQGDVCPGGVYPRMRWSRHSPSEQNDWQTPVKILPCRNFVADGDKILGFTKLKPR